MCNYVLLIRFWPHAYSEVILFQIESANLRIGRCRMIPIKLCIKRRMSYVELCVKVSQLLQQSTLKLNQSRRMSSN